MDIYAILDRKSCSVGLSSRDKEGALRELSELAAQSDKTAEVDAETIYQLLAERESQGELSS